jgi:hypothetical protein
VEGFGWLYRTPCTAPAEKVGPADRRKSGVLYIHPTPARQAFLEQHGLQFVQEEGLALRDNFGLVGQQLVDCLVQRCKRGPIQTLVGEMHKFGWSALVWGKDQKAADGLIRIVKAL